MDEKEMRLAFRSSFDQWTEYNDSFDKGVLRVCYVGRNRNGTSISKEAVERSIESIYNCPIVCRYDREADELGAHDMEVVCSEEGDMRLVNLTHPVGVIPESARYWWTEVTEEDGAVHEYLCVEALLWKRQEAYQLIKERGITDQSMEISVKETYSRDGVMNIELFEFTAFCLLGTAEPCFESAALLSFSTEHIREQMMQMMREFKAGVQFSHEVVQPLTEVDIQHQNYSEGGNEALDNNMNPVVEEEQIVIDSVDKPVEDPVVEGHAAERPEEQPAADEQFALAGELMNELVRVLSAEQVDTCYGSMDRYWYVDHDPGLNEVYCYDNNDWLLYGFQYSMDGDNVVIDMESKKRMKYTIVEFDQGEQANPVGAAFAMMSERYTQDHATWDEKYQAEANRANAMQDELEELRTYRRNIEDAEAEQARNEVMERFGDLVGNESFEALRTNAEQFSIEELEEKCFAIRGRLQPVKFSLQEPKKAPKLPIEKTGGKAKTDRPYGGVFEEYGIGLS